MCVGVAQSFFFFLDSSKFDLSPKFDLTIGLNSVIALTIGLKITTNTITGTRGVVFKKLHLTTAQWYAPIKIRGKKPTGKNPYR